MKATAGITEVHHDFYFISRFSLLWEACLSFLNVSFTQGMEEQEV